jgi:hypothetical protein
LALAWRAADQLTGGVFVAGEVRAEVSSAVAQARLVRLGHPGGLLGASQDAYRAGLASLVPADPSGCVPQVAGLARVYFGNMIASGDSVHAPLRWEAIAPGGEVFPALDADLTLRPAGDQATTLTLTGVYRLPPGTRGNGLDQAVVRGLATATIQVFLNRVAAVITVSGPASERDGGTTDQGGSPPAAQAP